jgi:nucleotide-binding universal stress UspA family protein
VESPRKSESARTIIFILIAGFVQERNHSMTVAGRGFVPGSILFATDFSPEANKAGVNVTAIAQHYRSKVQLFHVVNLSAAFKTPDAGICIDIFRKSGEENLAKVKIQFSSGGVEVETILTEGLNPGKEILQAANDGAADLIAVGSRGQGGLARLALGSVAQHLIHHAKCPVLTAGPNTKPSSTAGSFQHMVCATDFSSEAAAAAKLALSFAESYGAHMFLCHVLPRPDGSHSIDSHELNENFKAELQRLIPDIAREWCEPECVVDHGYAADGILLLAERVRADLIILGTRRQSHWFTNLKAGIAFEVIRAAACPVITVLGETGI